MKSSQAYTLSLFYRSEKEKHMRHSFSRVATATLCLGLLAVPSIATAQGPDISTPVGTPTTPIQHIVDHL